jgi:beta-lactamase class A
MSSRDISVFLKTLYNSTILTPPYSELALKLMSESTFNDGIRQGVPTDVVIAHKFGEAGTPEDIQLHEAAIVYAPDHPYLISVMTRGTDMTAQKALIAQLSASAYNLLVATGTVPRASKEGGSKARSHNPVGP